MTTGDVASLAEITDRLTRWAADQYAPGAVVSDVGPMPGNSGISFGFRVSTPEAADHLVIRMPHPKANRQGSSDVLRQVRVLRAAASSGVPVPPVRFWADENPWFEVPYYVVDFVRGESTRLFDPERAADQDGAGLRPVFVDAMHVLASIHATDWRTHLGDWEVRSLVREVDAWAPTLEKSSNRGWVDLGMEVRDLLLERLPAEPRTGLVHGDYYSNNWLFDKDRIVAVVDWEIASISDPLLDVGWMCLMYDDASWNDRRHQWRAWRPDPAELIAAYEEAAGAAVTDIDFYRALAGYRLGCIAARAYELRTTGKIDDPAWDTVGGSYPLMMARAKELLLSRGRAR